MTASLPARYAAMALVAPGDPRLHPIERELRAPGDGELLLRVLACGVCRTDLHIADGDLQPAHWPLVPGHEIVGVVAAAGAGVTRFAPGQRVGVPWLHRTCGHCGFCLRGRENLCEQARFTGLSVDGGYAEFAIARADHCFALPERYDAEHAAPLLCAGLIGYRALRMAGEASPLGIYGFGAAGHLVAQVALQQGRRVFAFTRPGDASAQAFARSLGVQWAGGSDEAPPQPLQAALLFAPVGELVPAALAHTEAGGVVVCAGIHMSDIPRFSYRLLWRERILRSVANLTRADGDEFFAWVASHPLALHTELFELGDANAALAAVRAGRIDGAAVLRCS
jgi:propanol-preferring alcohol dehydrogenase